MAPKRIARARFVLARALRDAPAGQGRDRERAPRLAAAARDDDRRAQGQQDKLDEVEAWLASRRSRR